MQSLACARSGRRGKEWLPGLRLPRRISGLAPQDLDSSGPTVVTASGMASDSGDRGTACTVRVEASCGSLAGQRASAPGVIVNLRMGEGADTWIEAWGPGWNVRVAGPLALMLRGVAPGMIVSDNEEGA